MKEKYLLCFTSERKARDFFPSLTEDMEIVTTQEQLMFAIQWFLNASVSDFAKVDKAIALHFAISPWKQYQGRAIVFDFFDYNPEKESKSIENAPYLGGPVVNANLNLVIDPYWETMSIKILVCVDQREYLQV